MHYRTIFVSDLHLGMNGSRLEPFLQFIKNNECETIYIVGDFIDFWALKRSSKYWSQLCNDVLQKFLRKHRKGTKCVWVTGNHDEFMEQFHDCNFGGIEIKKQDIHTTVDGKRYLVIHGHQLDPVMKYAKWLMYFGSWMYDVLLWLNKHFNYVRSLLGLRYWSLSAFLKQKSKSAVNFIGSFEQGIVQFANNEKCHGVIAGHVHHPSIKIIDGITYINTGDWIESISCVVEHFDGTMELLQQKDGALVRSAVTKTNEKKVEYS